MITRTKSSNRNLYLPSDFGKSCNELTLSMPSVKIYSMRKSGSKVGYLAKILERTWSLR